MAIAYSAGFEEDRDMGMGVELTGKCRARHSHAGVGPCVATLPNHTSHRGFYRIPGTTHVISAGWVGPGSGTPPLCACGYPSGHEGLCQARELNELLEAVSSTPTFEHGDRVMLRRGVWDALTRQAMTSAEAEAFLDGNRDPRRIWDGSTELEGPASARTMWPLEFRYGVVMLVDPSPQVVLVTVRHETGTELEWRRDLLLPMDATEIPRDRWEDDDGDYRDRLQDGREVI